jgi:hypothetical protein
MRERLVETHVTARSLYASLCERLSLTTEDVVTKVGLTMHGLASLLAHSPKWRQPGEVYVQLRAATPDTVWVVRSRVSGVLDWIESHYAQETARILERSR